MIIEKSIEKYNVKQQTDVSINGSNVSVQFVLMGEILLVFVKVKPVCWMFLFNVNWLLVIQLSYYLKTHHFSNSFDIYSIVE